MGLKTIIKSLDDYGFEIDDKRGLTHLLQSARNSKDLYSYNVLERKFSKSQPLFNFVAQDLKHDVVDEEEEDEYLGELSDH